MTQIVDDVQSVLAQLHGNRWWQGSLIHHSEIPDLASAHAECEWWIVASQACNIYSDDFVAIPVIELIGASPIGELKGHASGSHPREIHLAAYRGPDELFVRAESQKRVWMQRHRLIDLPAPPYQLENRHTQPFSNETLWLDKFSSWLARGYTRAALPDAFNRILGRSKIRDVLEEKLAKKQHEGLFGIFLTITSEQNDAEPELGRHEPPYELGILVACYEDTDPAKLQVQLLRQLFTDEVKDPDQPSAVITRSQLANRLGIRIIKEDVEVRSISEVYLIDLLGRNTVRYNLVDFHSGADSSPL